MVHQFILFSLRALDVPLLDFTLSTLCNTSLFCHIKLYSYRKIVYVASYVLCLPFTGYVATGLCVSQVKVREEDEGWIYGMYTCRSGNKMGSADWEIELKRASKWHGHHDNLHANNDQWYSYFVFLP